MKTVTRTQVVEALKQVGVQEGDGLLVHSAIQFLGKPAGGVGMYYEALGDVLELATGEERPATGDQGLATSDKKPRYRHLQPATLNLKTVSGTLAVPAFNFAFARGEPYDPQATPSQGMGAFSEYVRQLPQARRTPHPMQSLAVAGRHAADLAGRDTPSAFDPGSTFERMLALDFKLLLLGADVQAVSMLHYSEQRANVPYRFWKDFTGQVRTGQGWETRTYRMFVRDLEMDARLDLHPVQELLQSRQQWSSLPLNYGRLCLCRLSDFVAAVDEFLETDPWSLVTNREEALKNYVKRDA